MRKVTTIDRLVKGAIDCHVHAGPDPFHQRRLDAVQLAREAQAAQMRAVVLKSHHYGTAPLAYIVNQVVPEVLVVGSLVLNEGVGGLNPAVVEVAAKTGAKLIWMPTYSSVVDTKRRTDTNKHRLPATKAVCDRGISLLGEGGELVPQMTPILEIIKDGNLVLATGHISVPEIYAISTEAKRMGIKVVITHPLTEDFGSTLTIEQQQALVHKGAFVEHCFDTCMPLHGGLNPLRMAEAINKVGAEHCILSTDFGQADNPTPVEGIRMMIATLLECGLNEKELELLVKVNPAKLLDLA